jgi:hypothetical protein
MVPIGAKSAGGFESHCCKGLIEIQARADVDLPLRRATKFRRMVAGVDALCAAYVVDDRPTIQYSVKYTLTDGNRFYARERSRPSMGGSGDLNTGAIDRYREFVGKRLNPDCRNQSPLLFRSGFGLPLYRTNKVFRLLSPTDHML